MFPDEIRRFQIGDIIIAHWDAPYSKTDHKSLCKVVKQRYASPYEDLIVAKIIYTGYPGYEGAEFGVNAKHFDIVTSYQQVKHLGLTLQQFKAVVEEGHERLVLFKNVVGGY